MHIICILYAYYMYMVCILYVYCMHICAYTMHITFILHAECMHAMCMHSSIHVYGFVNKTKTKTTKHLNHQTTCNHKKNKTKTAKQKHILKQLINDSITTKSSHNLYMIAEQQNHHTTYT